MRVVAPAELDVFRFDRRTATIDFLSAIRLHARRPGVGIRIDLSQVVFIAPQGAVMLWAEIDRAMSTRLGQASTLIIRPANRIVDAVMQQIGVYPVIGPPLPEAAREDVKHWRAATGVLSEGQKGGTILRAYQGRLADGITKGLYDGLVEAMTNTVHHAYDGDIGTPLRYSIGKRWWMLSQEREGELTVAICDLGIGIPRSLPRSQTFENSVVRAVWKGMGLDRSDASAIKVALELGRTSTGRPGRGRGLSEIVEAVNLSKQGRVLICSNRGVFSSVKGESKAYNHSHSIRGTLIHWTVPVTNEDEAHGDGRD